VSRHGALRLAGTAARLAASRWGGARPPLVAASIYPTFRCNLRCVYCSSPYRKVPELGTDDWRRILDEVAALGGLRVAILGGEPLLRPDVGALVDHAKAAGLAVTLTTNGALVPRKIDELGGLDTMVVSLDGVGDANDAQRGEGVFEQADAAIDCARGSGIPVKVNVVLTERSGDALEELLDYLERRDLQATVNLVRSGDDRLWHRAASVQPPDERCAELLDRLADLAESKGSRILFSPASYRFAARWGEFRRDRIERGDVSADDRRLREAPPCSAGRSMVVIQPDGSVAPCSLTSGAIRGGNAAHEGLARALEPLRSHGCLACFTPCLVEQNSVLAGRANVVGRFWSDHLRRFA